MERKNENFLKEILEVCNKHAIIGMSRMDQATMLLNIFMGLFLAVVEDVRELEGEEDETIH